MRIQIRIGRFEIDKYPDDDRVDIWLYHVGNPNDRVTHFQALTSTELAELSLAIRQMQTLCDTVNKGRG